MVSRERIAVGRIGFLYAFELGKLQNRLNSLMQMPFGFVMGSEHWPGVGRDTLLMCDIAPQNVAVNCACQPSEPVGADF